MPNRLDKVTGRYRELTGKPFKKLTEARLSTIQVIEELEESIKELSESKSPSILQIQKLQARLIIQKRKLKDLEKV